MYYSADLHDVLGFDVGLRLAMSRLTDADKTYTLSIPSMTVDPSTLGITTYNGVSIPAGSKLTLTSGVNYPSRITANTAAGPKDNTAVNTIGGSQAVISSSNTQINGKTVTLPAKPKQILLLPGGFDITSLGTPLPMPQFDLGLPFGLEFY